MVSTKCSAKSKRTMRQRKPLADRADLLFHAHSTVGAICGGKQVAALVVVWHLGQVLHINTHKAVETPYQRLGADSKALRLETP